MSSFYHIHQIQLSSRWVHYNHQSDAAYYGADLEIVDSGSFFARDGKNNDRYNIYTFDTSKEQESEIDSYYKQIGQESTRLEGDKNRTFNVLSDNCTDVVVGAMKSGGISSDNFSATVGGISTPNTLKKQLEVKFYFQDKWYAQYLPLNFNSITQKIKSKDIYNSNKN